MRQRVHIEKDRRRRRTLDRSVSRGGFKDERESNEAKRQNTTKEEAAVMWGRRNRSFSSGRSPHTKY